MENTKPVDLGLDDTNKEAEKTEKTIAASKKKADEALKKAAATAAVKASIEAQTELSMKEAEKTYIVEKKKAMLNKCKSDSVRKVVGNKLFASYFGEVYTFLYNTVPVTIRFDGTAQEFPSFVADKIEEKIAQVSESSVSKEIIDKL